MLHISSILYYVVWLTLEKAVIKDPCTSRFVGVSQGFVVALDAMLFMLFLLTMLDIGSEE